MHYNYPVLKLLLTFKSLTVDWQHYVSCLQGSMFWLTSQTGQSLLPPISFFIFLAVLEWPDVAVLLSADAVLAAKLQHDSQKSCPGEPTDFWASESKSSALDSHRSDESVFLCSDEIGCSRSLISVHWLVVAAWGAAKPVTNSYFEYHFVLFQFISLYEEIINSSFQYTHFPRFLIFCSRN